jgi:dCTP deaminase
MTRYERNARRRLLRANRCLGIAFCFREHDPANTLEAGFQALLTIRATLELTGMSIKSDKWIRRMAEEHGMIEPFEPGQIRLSADGQKIVSYGTSSYGYDIRCAPEFKVFTNIHSTVVDPKNFDEKSFVDFNDDVCIIPPNSFALARTMEYFRIPRNVLTICLGKSTYARCGIIVNVTPFEPEWEGYVTLEFSNTTPLPAKIYAGEGCAQVLFFESDKDDVCEVSYKDRGGKYQGQVGVTLPKA